MSRQQHAGSNEMKIRDAQVEKGLFLPSLSQAADKQKTPKRKRTMSKQTNLTPGIDRDVMSNSALDYERQVMHKSPKGKNLQKALDK